MCICLTLLISYVQCCEDLDSNSFCFVLEMYFSLPQLFVFLFDVLSAAMFVIRDRFVKKKKPACLNLYPCVIKYYLVLSYISPDSPFFLSICLSLYLPLPPPPLPPISSSSLFPCYQHFLSISPPFSQPHFSFLMLHSSCVLSACLSTGSRRAYVCMLWATQNDFVERKP